MRICIGKFAFITVTLFVIIFLLLYVFTDLLFSQDYFIPTSPEKSRLVATFSVGDRILKMIIVFIIAIVGASVFTMIYNKRNTNG